MKLKAIKKLPTKQETACWVACTDELRSAPNGMVFGMFSRGTGNEINLYFSFATYGTKALNYTFKTTDLLNFNNLDVYEFIFAIYDEGRAGIFAYRINEGPYIALNSERII